MNPRDDAEEISARISRLSPKSTTNIRRIRSTATKRLRVEPGAHVLAIADQLVDDHRWVAYELVYRHREASSLIDEVAALRLAGDFADWGAVDAYCRYISGPAWCRQQLPDRLIR